MGAEPAGIHAVCGRVYVAGAHVYGDADGRSARLVCGLGHVHPQHWPDSVDGAGRAAGLRIWRAAAGALRVGLYLVVQTLESAAVSPVVQQRLIQMPPALILIGQLIIGAFTGLLGLTLATPIIAIIIVVVKMLYVQDVLGDEEVKV